MLKNVTNSNTPIQSDNNQTLLMSIAGPLIDSEGFKRLHRATFLGILSPKFAEAALVDVPVSFTGIATWPLSHTGEAAFHQSSSVDTKTLRIQMIEGSKKLPSSLHLNRAIADIGLDTSVLISLLDAKNPAKSKSVETLWLIIHSPITPDTLEGIWRTGRVFGVDVPEPRIVASAIDKDSSVPFILKSKSKPILSFWRRKAELYNKIINNEKIIFWESMWSFSIAHHFKNIELEKSLYLDEEEIIKTVRNNEGLLEPPKVQRYKAPLKYYPDQQLYRKRVLDSDRPIIDLHEILKKEKIKEDSLNWTKSCYRISKV